MSNKIERGARSERSSALWGTGSRGGDRSSVLWGKGGRGIVVSCLAALALAAPLRRPQTRVAVAAAPASSRRGC